jgi:hypothetical protein
MPTLEPTYEEAESIALSGVEKGEELGPEQAEWVNNFYRNVKGRMLNLYDGARLGAWRIYDRQRLADYWQEQFEWFNRQLEFTRSTQQKVAVLALTPPAALTEAVETLTEIVEACRGAYELFS